jgi:hypothetical protein
VRLRDFFSILLCGLLAAAQPGPAPAKLNLAIVEGEGAVNNVRQRVTREPIVQVQDENGRPVSGAAVAFLLPSTGPSGAFADGSRMLTILTDQNGRAIQGPVAGWIWDGDGPRPLLGIPGASVVGAKQKASLSLSRAAIAPTGEFLLAIGAEDDRINAQGRSQVRSANFP